MGYVLEQHFSHPLPGKPGVEEQPGVGAAQLELTGDMCALVREWMVAQGFRVVSTSMAELVQRQACFQCISLAGLKACSRGC